MAAPFRGLLVVLLITLYIAKRRGSRHSSNTRFPPGPKGFPLLGAVLSVDASKPWSTYFHWRKLYGGYHVQCHPTNLIRSR